MSTATVTAKGQITIPASVRRALRVDTGSRVEFVEVGEGRFELVAASRSIKALKGVVKAPAQAVSIGAMNAAIRQRGRR